MDVLLAGDLAPTEWCRWRRALQDAWPQARWLDAADVAALADGAPSPEVAVVANPAPGSLRAYPRLRLIHSLWAGVDRLLADDTLPAAIPIVRMVDPAMTAAMAETALWAVLSLHRGFFRYAERQRAGVWRTHAQRRADELRVGVLGLGQMGRAAAGRIAALGYRVTGWRATPAGPGDTPPGQPPLPCDVVAGNDAWPALLAGTDILVNLLPLTAATRGLLDARAFALLPRDAAIVNLGRGAHLVEADLIAALDSGHLRHAVLDVFATEPLPAGHAFWSHPRVTVLPHAAALTDPRSAARVVSANLQAWSQGRPIGPLVERERGY